MLGFTPEMNGNWYARGYQHAQHVVARPAYVRMIGIDGYYDGSSQTFSFMLAPVLSSVPSPAPNRY